MTYDNVKEDIVMICKVRKNEWFSVGFGTNMHGAGAIIFQGLGENGEVRSTWLGDDEDPLTSTLVNVESKSSFDGVEFYNFEVRRPVDPLKG
jgi:hypothetical protein